MSSGLIFIVTNNKMSRYSLIIGKCGLLVTTSAICICETQFVFHDFLVAIETGVILFGYIF